VFFFFLSLDEKGKVESTRRSEKQSQLRKGYKAFLATCATCAILAIPSKTGILEELRKRRKPIGK